MKETNLAYLRHKASEASETGGDTDMSLFVSAFADKGKDDLLIVAFVCAWLSNGYANECYMAEHIVNDIMQGKPSEYIRMYTYLNNISGVSDKNGSFFCLLTFKNFDNLCLSLHRILSKGGWQYVCNALSAKRRKRVYAHDIVIELFSDGVGFPTKKSKGTSYRINLFLYWATYKLRILDCARERLLLPCDDGVFDNAYRLGVVNKEMKHNLKNAAKLTEMAQRCFDGYDFYKIYELLSKRHD